MAKSIFSFLFSGDGAQTGAKQGGKGDADLVSMGTADAAQQVKLQKNKGIVKGKASETPEKKVVKSEKRKSRNAKSVHASNKKANSIKKNMQRTVRKRTLEIKDKEKEARLNLKTAQNATLNKSAKIKVVKDFVQQLPSDTQDLIKEQLKQKVLPQTEEKKKNVQNTKKQEQLSKRELLEKKRGIYRQEQTALRLAKMAAEKARNMVKGLRNRILGNKSVQPINNQPQNKAINNKNSNALKTKERQNIRR